jgi:hypothetical protein
MTSLEDKKEAIESARVLFDHVQDQIVLADTKALLIVAADGFLATAIAELVKEIAAKSITIPGLFKEVVYLFTFLMFGAILISVFYALRSAKPSQDTSARQTPFYFGHINQWSENEFIDKFQSQLSNQLCASILAQVHTKAKIVNQKFDNIRRSLRYLFLRGFTRSYQLSSTAF